MDVFNKHCSETHYILSFTESFPLSHSAPPFFIFFPWTADSNRDILMVEDIADMFFVKVKQKGGNSKTTITYMYEIIQKFVV